MLTWVESGRRPRPAKPLEETPALVQIQLSALKSQTINKLTKIEFAPYKKSTDRTGSRRYLDRWRIGNPVQFSKMSTAILFSRVALEVEHRTRCGRSWFDPSPGSTDDILVPICSTIGWCKGLITPRF